MTCKGICSRYKAQKPVGTGRYASGQRRCQICEIFIKWEGLWCPCCGYRLRTKPRNLKYKAKLRARVEAEAQEAIAVQPTIDTTVAVKVKRTRKAKVVSDAQEVMAEPHLEETTTKVTRTRKVKAKVVANAQEAIAIKA